MEFYKYQTKFLHLIVITFLNGLMVCRCHLCLTWSIHRQNLHLTCKTDDLQLKIIFHDNLNEEKGFCLLSYPKPLCHSHSENDSISINVVTNETVLVVHDISNRHIEGRWTCRHGTNYEYAIVNITRMGFRDVIKGLSITTSTVFPLINGLLTVIICSATAKDVYTVLTWDCLNLTPLQTSVIDCKTYVSKLEYKASLTDNGKLCKCSARVNTFLSTAEITFEVQKAPVLQIKREIECNISNPFSIDCHVDGFLPRYGFSPWTHSVKGMVIRHISGLISKEKNTSTLFIDPCKLDDMGTYTCNVITLDKRELMWTNSSKLLTQGRPLILKTDINSTKDTVLMVQFYSVPEPTVVKWSAAKVLLPNISQHMQYITQIDIKRPMYGKLVTVNGYMAQLIQRGEYLHNSYCIFIENPFGNSSYHFIVKKETFLIRNRLLQRSFIHYNSFSLSNYLDLIMDDIYRAAFPSGNELNTEYLKSPSKSKYHAAPQINNVANVYDGLRNQYLEVIDYPSIHLATESRSDTSTKDSERDDATHSYEEISDLTLHQPAEHQESMLAVENLESPHYIELE
ncbi:unnamed protein product [Mytilus coruscus]|uniref:Ig-like domain-containing protein n=1 Tax=Mytilus coruscus TaxID=42192 RepID=A0A6J7ZT48_MYTCO|nr:unnamed protein product [Mytilus coruscus]